MSEAMELTNDMMKPVLSDAMVWRGSVRVPLEEVIQSGRYTIDAGTPESDLSYFSGDGGLPRLSHLEVMTRGTTDVIQRITSVGTVSPEMVVRVCRMGAWKPWYRIAVTPLS